MALTNKGLEGKAGFEPTSSRRAAGVLPEDTSRPYRRSFPTVSMAAVIAMRIIHRTVKESEDQVVQSPSSPALNLISRPRLTRYRYRPVIN